MNCITKEKRGKNVQKCRRRNIFVLFIQYHYETVVSCIALKFVCIKKVF